MNKMILSVACLAITGVCSGSSADVMAFYAFKDATPGTPAASVALKNSIDDTKFIGTVTVSSKGTNSAATIVADAPGKYIYSSRQANATLLASDPQSVHLSADGNNKGCGGTISFADIATEFSKHHDDGFTLEFFFRNDGEPFYACAKCFELLAGYTKEDGSPVGFDVFPEKESGTGTPNKMRYGFGGYSATSANSSGSSRKGFINYTDGDWHHVVLLQTKDKSIRLYVDGRSYIDQQIDTERISWGEVSGSTPLSLAFGALCGKYSCVRMTGRELASEEWLYVSDQESLLLADTLAFYPFDDRPAGSSAEGASVANASIRWVGAGLVAKGKDASSAATFDADAPGKYVFAGNSYPGTPIYTNPASLHLTASADVNGQGGSVCFERLGNELSAYHADGHTIEYFLKMDDEAFSGYTEHLECNAGYVAVPVPDEGEGVRGSYPFKLYMPFAKTYSEGRQFRYALSTYNNPAGFPRTQSTLDYVLWDGKWHHVAVVETNNVLSVWVDYQPHKYIEFSGTTNVVDAAESFNLTLGGPLHARYSCLKVSKRALGKDEFLRVSNSPTCVPTTEFVWTFDGVKATTFPKILTNAIPSVATIDSCQYAATRTGNGTVAGSPVYGGRLMWRYSSVEDGFGTASRTNAGCAYFKSTTKGISAWREGPYVGIKLDEFPSVLAGEFTVEGFFRFHKKDWESTSGAFAKANPRVTLFSVVGAEDKAVAWNVSIQDAASDSQRLELTIRSGDTDVSTGTAPGGFLVDEKWHHIALTYDKENHRFAVYYDYEQAISKQLDADVDYGIGMGTLYFGNGPASGANSFHGWMDEIRCYRECLGPENFQRQKGYDPGVLLIVR